jgi:hypothetical protein
VTGAGLDTKAAAQRLGVSERTMQRYIDKYWQKGDRSKGFVVTKLHVNRGHGYEWRIHFPDDDSPDTPADTPPDTTPPPTVVSDALAVPDATPATTPPLVGGLADRELAVLALRALDEVRRENERLRAVVESLRRPWWRKVWGKVRRRS